MNIVEIFLWVNLFFNGMLAGEELAVYYGVRTPVTSLEERPQTLLRQALIRRLRLLVPGIYMPTLVSAVAVTVLGGSDLGPAFRVTGLLALLIWALVTFPGTARINSAILDWDPTSLPKDWRDQVKLWERFASVRPWAAMAAFALFLTAFKL